MSGSTERPTRSLLVSAALAVTVLWLFRGPLLQGQVLYFRDISVTYYPDHWYVARWLARGLWPLWHAAADAGAPFLPVYPLDLAFLWLLGAPATLALSPPLHLLLLMAGAYRLARDLGRSPVAAVIAATVLGLSGLTLSSVLFPNFMAGAWMPWVVWRTRALWREPSLRSVAALGVLAALQVSTLGGEVALQSALIGLVLAPRLPGRRELGALAGAGLLAASLAAPALLGLRALLEGSERGAGFSESEALAYSAHPAALLESVLPRFFGDVHTMTAAGYWGQPFFPSGNPYYLSLYLGSAVLVLAAGGRDRRLLGLAALGLLASLGEYGPLAPLLSSLTQLRGPVKFFYLTTAACALLAAEGYDRVRAAGRVGRAWVVLAPGVALLGLSMASALAPAGVAAALAFALPGADPALACAVVAEHWPRELAVTGATALALGATLASGGRKLPSIAVLVAFELARVNGGLAATADASFYELRPETARLVEHIRAEGSGRVFAYGVANSPPLRWSPQLLEINSDVWLYYMDRQSLIPRTQVLDGLDGALDLDRMGWAPAGASLTAREYTPLRWQEHRFRLLLAGVRWVLSFHPLGDGTRLAASARFPEVLEPLLLYELEGALPRAFWVPRAELGLAASFDPRLVVRLAEEPPLMPARTETDREPRVRYERPDPHHVRLELDTPPGFIVVAEGYDQGWTAAGPEGPIPLLRANGRYWALPTRGGEGGIDVRFEPSWRRPALALCVLGVLAAVVMSWPRVREHKRPGGGATPGLIGVSPGSESYPAGSVHRSHRGGPR